jgi:adenylate cyclase
VLPFANLTRDPEQEYFADGMVEDITTALARTGQFFVIARNSSFVYKGRAVDVKQVGRELGVRYVLEGSVRKAGSRIRISGQLIEAESGRHLWADRFEGALEDVFDLQDRITESVVWAIAPSVRRAEIERSRVKPTSSLQAYDLVLRALPGILPGASKAQKDETSLLVDRALKLDARYSLAKAYGACACMHRVIDGQGDAEDVKTGLRLAEEALADHRDDPMTLAYAALTLGTLGYRVRGVTVMGFRYDEALGAINRALSLTTNLATVTFAAGMVRLWVGDGDAAIAHFERTMRLSPLDPVMGAYITGMALAHIVCGRYQEGLAEAEQAIRENPNYAFAHRARTVALAYLGRIDEAKVAAARMLEVAPEFTVSLFLSVIPIRDPKRRKKMAGLLRAAGVPK